MYTSGDLDFNKWMLKTLQLLSLPWREAIQSSVWKTNDQAKSVVSSSGLAQANFENKFQKAEYRTGGDGSDNEFGKNRRLL